MLFSARIKELEGQLTALTTERDTLATANRELTAANEECATRHATDQQAIADALVARDAALEQVAALTTERDTAQRELAAERETRETAIATAVTQRLAEAGPAPIARDPAATAKNEPKAETGLKGMARARAYFASRQPEPAESSTV